MKHTICSLLSLLLLIPYIAFAGEDGGEWPENNIAQDSKKAIYQDATCSYTYPRDVMIDEAFVFHIICATSVPTVSLEAALMNDAKVKATEIDSLTLTTSESINVVFNKNDYLQAITNTSIEEVATWPRYNTFHLKLLPLKVGTYENHFVIQSFEQGNSIPYIEQSIYPEIRILPKELIEATSIPPDIFVSLFKNLNFGSGLLLVMALLSIIGTGVYYLTISMLKGHEYSFIFLNLNIIVSKSGVRFERIKYFSKNTKSATPSNSSIADFIVNDAALQKAEQDLLGTSTIAQQLSLFLQNQSTNPPVTLAVTGDWGSGKSSIMGMLKNEMQEARYYPIWINAWHHHQEEYFFGALLEKIRNEAVPPVWHLSGAIFRLKLLYYRTLSHLWLLIGIILATTFFGIAGITLSELPQNIWQVLQFNLNQSNWLNSVSAFGVAAVGVAFISALLNGLSTFGLTPRKVFKKMSLAMKPNIIDVDPGLRYKVIQSLSDITKALGNKPLVIFIDDLDRCPSDQVLKVLECVNFLSSSPLSSFIVLGMALDKVLPSISKEFEKVVEESSQHTQPMDEKVEAIELRQRRLAHAKHYLEKMINIEVHAPQTTPAQMKNLATTTPVNNQSSPKYKQIYLFLRQLDQVIFPLIVAASLLSLVIIGGNYLAETQETMKKKEKILSESQTTTQTEGNQPTNTENQNTEETNKELDKIREQRSVQTDRLKAQTQSSVQVSLFVIVILWWIYIFGARRAEVQDTPDFIEALKIWTPVLMYQKSTPRYFKRAINQLRLMAMKLQMLSGASYNPHTIIRIIVLKALRDAGAEWPQAKAGTAPTTPLTIANIRAFFNLSDSELAKILKNVLTEHNKKFPNEWPQKDDINIFHELIKGITLR